MTWQGVPFLFPALNDAASKIDLDDKPLKVIVEMTPTVAADHTALWAALIGAFVSAAIAFFTQYINSRNQSSERSHQASLIVYQTSNANIQAWAMELRNEAAAYISYSTAAHNLHNNLMLLYREGKTGGSKFDDLHKAILDKKESLGRVKAKIDLLLGGKKDAESINIIGALEDIRTYFGGFTEVQHGFMDLLDLNPMYENLVLNVKLAIDKEINSISPTD